MPRDHSIPADDRTKVFRLLGCSLPPLASSLSPASGSLISIESSVESDVCTRRKAVVCGLAASLRFDRLVRRTSSPSRPLIHLYDLPDGLEVRRTRSTTPLDENIGEQPIDWRVLVWNAMGLSKEVGGLITGTCGLGGPHYGEQPNSQTAKLARWYVSRSMGCGWFELIGSLGYSCGV